MILFRHNLGSEVLAIGQGEVCFTNKSMEWSRGKLKNSAYKPVFLVLPKEYMA
jgi:hypothetical protein|tara:strand:+ start:33412 stop:33570 length:159 start_codon:yes stop_codon:yes gene_type:complete